MLRTIEYCTYEEMKKLDSGECKKYIDIFGPLIIQAK
jgi:hypothetical protein